MRKYMQIRGLFRRFFLLLAIGAASHPLLAQQTVTGTVTNESGQPLAGVNVVLKGGKGGTITDANGKYSIAVPGKNAVLNFSFVGYASFIREAGRGSNLNVQLSPVAAEMNETVVIGYGSRKKAEITGSVSTVSARDIQKNPVGNVSKSLQGLAPGIQVSSSSVPGSNAVIRIHGMGTINNNDPLWVVDGVPSAGGLESLNPGEIESITVLKDASATAIYGVRAANGVILVSTRHGRKGQAPEVIANIRDGVIRNTKKYDMLNPTEMGELIWLQAKNSGVPANNPVYGSGPMPVIPKYIFPAGAATTDVSLYDKVTNPITEANPKGTDWYKAVYNQGVTQQYDISVTGGAKNSRYALAGGYLDEQGMVKLTGFRRYNFRSNSSVDITDWLTIGEDFGFSQSNQLGYLSEDGVASIFGQVMQIPSIIPVYDIMGNYAPVSRISGLQANNNPVAELNREADFTRKNLGLQGNAFAQVSLMKGLTVKTLYGINYIDFHGRSPNEANPESYIARQYDQLTESYNETRQWNWTNTLNYTKSFGDHAIDFLIGTEAIDNKYQAFSATRINFFTTDPNYFVLSAGQGQQTNDGTASEWATSSYFGRLHYGYKSKYLFDATLRRDGSSRFGQNNRFGTFPAFAAAWRVSQEHFMESTRQWLDNVKLRASWGRSGNDQIGNYNGYTTFSNNIDESYYPITGSNNTSVAGFQSQALGNPDAKWETTTSTNLGLDATVFRNLDLTVDVWRRTTTDMLYPQKIPGVEGQAVIPSVNVGDMQNRGIDLQLNYRGPQSKNGLNYNLTLNVSHFKNKIIKLSNDLSTQTLIGTGTQAQAGTSFPEFYGYKVAGIFQSKDEAAKWPTAIGATGTYNAPGHFKFVDVNKDGVISDLDRTYIGNPYPDFTAGLNANVQYRGFDLSALFFASYGNDIMNTAGGALLFSGTTNARRESLYQSWGSPYLDNNLHAKMPMVEQNQNTSSMTSSFFVENGSYLRLETLQLGYSLPQQLVHKFGVRSFRIYVMANNVFTITGYSGLDPELNVLSAIQTGVDDRGHWATPKRYLAGVSVGF